MENDPGSRFPRWTKQEKTKRKDMWKFLIALAVVSCTIMLILYSLWGYLHTSIDLSSLYKGLVLPNQARSTPASTPIIGTVASGTATPGTPAVSYQGYTADIFISQGNSLVYYLYTPANYNPAQKYPLVLVLHGGGERSNPNNTLAQNEKLLLNDPYASVWSADYNAPGNPHIQQNWPCFVVIPQMELPQQWVNVNVHKGSYVQPSHPSIPLLLAKELLDSLQQKYTSIDAKRLYITGLSNGGFGTWDAIERWPNYFAAAAPIAGAGDPSKAAVLKNLPVWAFHGSADATVPVSGSRDMIAAIQAAGGHPKYTEFAGQGHGVWSYVYSLNISPLRVTGFFSWLFLQHR
jgi:predicted peptidase